MKHLLWVVPVVAVLLLVTMTVGSQSVAGTAPAGGSDLQMLVGVQTAHDAMGKGPCWKCSHCPIETPNCCATYCSSMNGKCPKGYVCLG